MNNSVARKPEWWKEAVVYQIYVRSFKDTNGDGIGDLQGIIQKLDYLERLGIDVVWLSPICDSPNDDNGYDVRNYYDIMKEYGTLDDVDELLEKAHSRGIKVIMDLVVNHTSDEHEWFVESKSGKDSNKRDFYIWKDGKENTPPNNWGSFFSPSTWEYDDNSHQYYLHLFSVKQPDLNWENPKVREEVYKMMRWWLNKGMDGFRMDVINGLKKPEGFTDSKKPATNAQGYTLDPAHFFNNPGLIDILREMNTKVLSRYDVLTVGECSEATPTDAVSYTSLKGDALSMLFHFDTVALRDNFSVKALRQVQQKWYDITWNKAWSTQYLSNHDQPRQVSIYGDEQFRIESAKLLALMLHSLPGTPFIYQGEELGMTNTKMKSIDEYRDINAHFDYNVLLDMGKSNEEAISWLNRYSRDNSRTPMQWDNTKKADFTEGKPWIKVNENHEKINVKEQLDDEDSVFNFYRRLINLRKENPVMVYGDYNDVSPSSDCIYAYTRTLDDIKWLVVLNMSNNAEVITIDTLSSNTKEIICNYDNYNLNWNTISCPAWFAAIFKV